MSGRSSEYAFSRVLVKYKSRLKAVLQTSPILTNRVHRADGHCFLASPALGFIFGLLADVLVGVLERAREVAGSSIAAYVTVDAGRIDVKGAVNVLSYYVVWIGHESADYADFTDLTNRSKR